jgi:hypothetical protein
MKIKIKEDIKRYEGRKEWLDKIKEIEGQWVEVETEHLFNNQYNVTTPSGHGLRIMQHHVIDVEEDERIGRMKCHYCGKHSDISQVCVHCGESKYLRPFDVLPELHTVKVNKYWTLMYNTQYGTISPAGVAEVIIVNKRTGERFKSTKYEVSDTITIEKKVPQPVKKAIRDIYTAHKIGYRYVREMEQ